VNAVSQQRLTSISVCGQVKEQNKMELVADSLQSHPLIGWPRQRAFC
jgi:hypothetical protein